MDRAYNELGKGLNHDLLIEATSKGYHTFAMNMVNETHLGNIGVLSNEGSTELVKDFDGKYIVGSCLLERNELLLFLASEDGSSEIGILSNGNYSLVLSDRDHKEKMNFFIDNPVSSTFRIIHGCERMVYFTDNRNKPRAINLDRINDYFHDGDLVVSKLNLQRSIDNHPKLSLSVLEGVGSLKPGQYSVAIQYWSKDSAQSDYLSHTMAVNIYIDSTTKPYHAIRGSAHSDIETYYARKDLSSKAIRIDVSGLDTSFDFYRLAVVPKNTSTGLNGSAMITDLIPTSLDTFIFTGGNYTSEEPIGNIIVDTSIIERAEVLTSHNNRLVMGNIKEPDYPWHVLQLHANKIKSQCEVKTVGLDTMSMDAPKNPTLFQDGSVGYMPGEMYSFGIVYVLDNGLESPVFHIPGSSSVISGSGFPMSNDNEVDYTYNKKWYGELYGKKVRHHRFPTRSELGLSFIDSRATLDSSITTNNVLYLYYNRNKDLVRNKNYRASDLKTISYEFTYKGQKYSTSEDIDIRPITVSQENDGRSKIRINAPLEVKLDDIFDIKLKFVHEYTEKERIREKQEDGSYVEKEVDVDRQTNETISFELVVDAKGRYYRPTAASSQAVSKLGQYYANDIYITEGLYDVKVDNSKIEPVSTPILGISFHNITIPDGSIFDGHRIVGYYIVRNERLELDKTIIDSAVILPMIKSKKYISSGILLPESNKVATADIDKRSYALLSLSSKFKTIDMSRLSRIDIEGAYKPDVVKYGLWLENNVREGTTRHKESVVSDSDGWDIACFSRSNYMSYLSINPYSVSSISDIDRIFELNALSYEQIDGSMIYNTAVDNKIHVVRFLSDKHLYKDDIRAIPYCLLRTNNPSSYNGFSNRPYYKQHQHMIDISSSSSSAIYSGDNYISGVNYQNHVFYENKPAYRASKHDVKKVLGVALAVIGVAAAIFTGGSTLAITATALASVGAGAILFAQGLEYSNFSKALIQEYQKGLRDTIIDGWVRYWSVRRGDRYLIDRDLYSEDKFNTNAYSQFSSYDDYRAAGEDGFDDDTILWFTDVACNLYFDTQDNIWLRSNPNGPFWGFIPSPYAIEDSNNDPLSLYVNSDGRDPEMDYISSREREPRSMVEKASRAKLMELNTETNKYEYRGLALGDFWYLNKDYNQNHIKPYFHLPDSYDSESKCKGCFPSRIVWSSVGNSEQSSDTWRVFKVNDYKDVDLTHLTIRNLVSLGNDLYIHTDKTLLKQPTSYQEKIVGDFVAYVGTGEFAQAPEQDMGYSQPFELGINNFTQSCMTKVGYAFASVNGKIYLLGDKMNCLSDLGMSSFFSRMDRGYTNPSTNPYGSSYSIGYDNDNDRIIVSYRSSDNSMVRHGLNLYRREDVDGLLSHGYRLAESGWNRIAFIRDDFSKRSEVELGERDRGVLEPNAYAISFSVGLNQWVSFHSYRPNLMFTLSDKFLSLEGHKTKMWSHNAKDSFQVIYGAYRPFVLEYAVSSNPFQTNIYDSLSFRTEAYLIGEDGKESKVLDTFDGIVIYNEVQSTGYREMKLREINERIMFMYLTPNNYIYVDRREKDYMVNDFRNSMSSSSIPYRLTEDILETDKEFVEASSKPWYESDVFRDKYVRVRFSLNDEDSSNMKLWYKYNVMNTEDSYR